MERKIRVLHYIPGFDHGGIESRLLDWYKHIDRNKVTFDILKLTPDNDNELIKEFIDLGGNVFTLPRFSMKSVISFMKALKSFFIVNHNYDVVHCHAPTTGYFILKEAKKYDIPLRIIHSRTTSFNPDEKNIIIKKMLKKITPIYANRYFACSKEAGEWIYNRTILSSDKFKVINNGIEAKKFIFNDQKRNQLRSEMEIEDYFVIGHIGRFSTAKNHPFIIEIFYEILKKRSNSKLILIGDGPTEDDTRKKAKKLGIENNVLFLGRQNNVEDYLQCMDVFLFPSYFEGFGTVAIEAQAAGLQCLASDGVPQAVDITGLIEHLPLSKGAVEWAETVLKYSNGYERRNMYEEIAKAGFDVITTAKWLEEFYIEMSASYNEVID